jgi:hypothetical protein
LSFQAPKGGVKGSLPAGSSASDAVTPATQAARNQLPLRAALRGVSLNPSSRQSWLKRSIRERLETRAKAATKSQPSSRESDDRLKCEQAQLTLLVLTLPHPGSLSSERAS